MTSIGILHRRDLQGLVGSIILIPPQLFPLFLPRQPPLLLSFFCLRLYFSPTRQLTFICPLHLQFCLVFSLSASTWENDGPVMQQWPVFGVARQSTHKDFQGLPYFHQYPFFTLFSLSLFLVSGKPQILLWPTSFAPFQRFHLRRDPQLV